MAFRKCFWIPGFEAKCLCFPVVFIFVGTCNECLLPSQKRNLLSFISVSDDFCPRLLLKTIESFQFTTKNNVLKCWLKFALKKCILDLYTIGVFGNQVYSASPKSVFAFAEARVITWRSEISHYFHKK